MAAAVGPKLSRAGCPDRDGGDDSVLSQRSILSLAQFERARLVLTDTGEDKAAGMLIPGLERWMDRTLG